MDYGLIISLQCSTNFVLCKQVLHQAREKGNVDFVTLLESPIVSKLSCVEKKHILKNIENIRKEQSLKAKIERLRKSCKRWAQDNEYKAFCIKIGVPISLYAAAMALHYKCDSTLLAKL